METMNLKDEVRKVLAVEWEAFAKRHPHLARVIDQELVIEQAVSSLGEDPEYRQAMEQAAAGVWGAEALAEVLRRLVADWLGRLI